METRSNHKQDRQSRRLIATMPLQVIAMALLLAVTLGSTATVGANAQSELDALKAATAPFQSLDAASQAGYEPFMDCFDNPGTGAMGYHYVNGSLMDLTVEALAPEAMVYEADANGQLHLVAVEYIVPAKEWDAKNTELPTLFGQRFHLNENLGVHVLHAWVWKDNPNGVFQDWNPTVSCRPMRTGAPGMPRTGSVDTLPAAMAAVAISTTLLLLGFHFRRRSPRSQ
jgi:hypothetical protein